MIISVVLTRLDLADTTGYMIGFILVVIGFNILLRVIKDNIENK